MIYQGEKKSENKTNHSDTLFASSLKGAYENDMILIEKKGKLL